MRRAGSSDQEAKVVEVIMRRGAKIFTQSVSVPAGVGIVLPLDRLFN
jgi:hypothetical protein